MTFSNGERLDAQVVADNFESQKRLGDSGFATTAKSHLANFTGAEVLDASTVALNFSEPSAGFLQAARSDTLAIIAPESLKKTPEERCAQGVIASGPFVQKELETNAKVVLARRDGYHWGSSLNKNKGEAYLDSITFLVVPESSVRIGGLTSGQLDAAIDIPSTDVDRAEGAGLTVIPSPCCRHQRLALAQPHVRAGTCGPERAACFGEGHRYPADHRHHLHTE